MFGSRMVTPAIPERVYELCKLVEKKPMAVKELQDKMEPNYLPGNSGTPYFADYRLAAEELGLINISDGFVSFSEGNSKAISSLQSMRQYANWHMSEHKEGQFYKVTQGIFSQDTAVFKYGNLTEMLSEVSEWVQSDVTAQNLLGWRFWASYLGLGYLNQRGNSVQFLPNAGVFIWDIISRAGIEKNQLFSIDEWIEKVGTHIDPIQKDLGERTFNFGTSCGLRMLHDQEYIKMDTIMDQKNSWRLYQMNSHKVPSEITHITVLRG